MARPQRMGLDYFPLDVDFFEDDRIALIDYEHGAVGVMVYLRLLCVIYRTSGYYCKFDETMAALTARRIGNGCKAEDVFEIVTGCLKYGLFDNDVFAATGMLTSAAIQRRYAAAIQERAKKAAAKGKPIYVEGEYWLLDEVDTALCMLNVDTSGVIPGKTTQRGELFQEKPSNVDDNSRNNSQSKGKEIKVKKIKEEERGKESNGSDVIPGITPEALPPPPLTLGQLDLVKVKTEVYKELCEQYGAVVVDDKISHMENWMRQKGWKKRDCTEMLRSWLAEDAAAGTLAAPAVSAPAAPPLLPGKRTSAHNFTQRQYSDEELETLLYTDLDHLNDE